MKNEACVNTLATTATQIAVVSAIAMRLRAGASQDCNAALIQHQVGTSLLKQLNKHMKTAEV